MTYAIEAQGLRKSFRTHEGGGRYESDQYRCCADTWTVSRHGGSGHRSAKSIDRLLVKW